MDLSEIIYYTVTAVALAIWVYRDALTSQRNQWLWGTGVLLNSTFFFPLYFWTRPPEFYWRCPQCDRTNRAWTRQCPRCEAVVPAIDMESRLYGFWTEADAVSIFLLTQATTLFVAFMVGVELAPNGEGIQDASKLWLVQMITVNVMLALSFYCITVRYRRAVQDIGLRTENWLRWMPLGLLAGLALVFIQNGITTIFAWAGSLFHFDLSGQLEREMATQQLGWPTSFHDPLLLVVLFVAGILVPLGEEILVRGIAYRAARARFGPGTGMIIISLVFAFLHQSPAFFPGLFVIGLALNYLYERTNSLLPSIFAHASINITAILVKVSVQ